ncbi:DUF1343 domain-containing protein [bacterium]|nr:DUF1343 domain-containing protein [bacterium]
MSESAFRQIARHRVGLVANPASLNSILEHTADLLYANQDKNFKLVCLFGPQHGFWGQTQDNMIEWEGFRHPRYNIPVYSLYGKHRKPTPEMLKDIDILLFDVPDIGSRYYTFIWTMALCMQACSEIGLKFMVLDRPNPINGIQLEGPVLESSLSSFVGLYPIPVRHGMTIGEIALLFNREFGISTNLEVLRMEAWERKLWFDETGLPWVMPSPNMPTLDTAAVYPGMCLLEGTNISEGRGTTRPFEIFGAPFIKPEILVSELRRRELPGVLFRPLYFKPTFNKYQDQLCGGAQIHLLDRESFQPFMTSLNIIDTVVKLYPDQFQWRKPPYEYETKRLPFDILAGNSAIRVLIEEGSSTDKIVNIWQKGLNSFTRKRKNYLLY